MRFELREYQKDALEQLFDRFERMLKSSDQEICIFQAPTGSGKTVVVAELLRKLVKEKRQKFRKTYINGKLFPHICRRSLFLLQAE